MSLDFSKAGYIYLLTNESFDGVVKIGYTRNPPEYRANELYTTGVPTPYQVWDYWFVEDAEQVEENIHVELFKNRSNRDREFFHINPNSAYKTIVACIEENRKQFLKNKSVPTKKQENHTHENPDYSNPKFVEVIKVLKENQGKLFTEKELADAVNMTPESVNKVLYVLEKQETKIIHRNPNPEANKKIGIYFKFDTPQLNILRKKYPKMDFSDLENLFSHSAKTPVLLSHNDAWIDIVKHLHKTDEQLKHNIKGKKKAYLTKEELATALNKNSKDIDEGLKYLINETGDDILFVIGHGQTQRYSLDLNFNLDSFKELVNKHNEMRSVFKKRIKKEHRQSRRRSP